MSFKDDLVAAKAAVDAGDRVKTPPIPVVVSGTAYEVVFYRASTEDWSNATMKHPPRPGVNVDQQNGYNISRAAREISAKYGRLVVDGEEVELTVTPASKDQPAVDEWADLWAVIAPAAARMLEANVWVLHEKDAERELEEAKKGSAPRRVSRKKPS